MAHEVYANFMAIVAKSSDGKSICAFPDVCLSPPSPPAGPIPIPYPNTGFASDTTSGSKSVKLKGKEACLKNKSYFSKSTGDEAATKTLGMGVVTHQITGKVYFNSWSMDVKIEGENVCRFGDLTTHNHMSFPGNSPTWPFLDKAAFTNPLHPCAGVAKNVKDNCEKHIVRTKGKKPAIKRKASIDAMCADPKCKKAMKCVLTTKSPNNCCPDSKGKKPTPHHIVPDSQFKDSNGKRIKLGPGKEYNYDAAPCVCAQGNSHSTGLHGKIHTETNNLTVNHSSVVKNVSPSGKSIDGDARWKVSEAEAVGAQAVAKETGCPEACIKAQTRSGHRKMGIKSNDKIRPTTAGKVTKPAMPSTGFP